MPKLNPLIANGLATTHMTHIESYIDDVFKTVAVDFPPQLKYLGYKRMTPLREFKEMTKQKHKRVYDVAKSYLYMVEYHFQYNDGIEDRTIIRPMHLPFVGDAGSMYISGSRFTISPVLNDRVISIGDKSVFARVFKAKMHIYRLPYHYRADGAVENTHVMWSSLYNAKSPIKPTVRARHTLAHYLFSKYGAKTAFKKFLKTDIVVGYAELEDEALYPKSKWVICSSGAWSKPRGLKTSAYIRSEIRLAIPRENYTEEAMSMIGGFFYVIDHLPTLAHADDIDNPAMWMLMLGHLIWSSDIKVGKLSSDVEKHIASLDTYLDAPSAQQLVEIGMPCADIYDLFFNIIKNFNTWMLNSRDSVCTMYDKELAILLFVCSVYTTEINRLFFDLKAAMSKDLNFNRVNKLFMQRLTPGLVFRLNSKHGEVSNISTSGDNKALKITNVLVPQTKTTKGEGTQQSIRDPAIQAHASIMEIGGYACMPKSAPDGRSRINQYVQISPTGLVMRAEDLRELVDSVQEKIKRI